MDVKECTQGKFSKNITNIIFKLIKIALNYLWWLKTVLKTNSSKPQDVSMLYIFPTGAELHN